MRLGNPGYSFHDKPKLQPSNMAGLVGDGRDTVDSAAGPPIACTFHSLRSDVVAIGRFQPGYGFVAVGNTLGILRALLAGSCSDG